MGDGLLTEIECWDLYRMQWGSDELDEALEDGWEPFAVSDGLVPWIYIRRRRVEVSDGR